MQTHRLLTVTEHDTVCIHTRLVLLALRVSKQYSGTCSVAAIVLGHGCLHDWHQALQPAGQFIFLTLSQITDLCTNVVHRQITSGHQFLDVRLTHALLHSVVQTEHSPRRSIQCVPLFNETTELLFNNSCHGFTNQAVIHRVERSRMLR